MSVTGQFVKACHVPSPQPTICVVGLGYVGLPLAVTLQSKYKVLGFDTSLQRVNELKQGYDRTGSLPASALQSLAPNLSDSPSCIRDAEVVIVTVPTPVDTHKRPDLTPLKEATQIVARNMKSGTTVVFESTVFPGVVEGICVPILEQNSGLTWKKHFHVGYSPERVNPGDPEHTVDKIVKIVAGDTQETATFLGQLYGSVISAGVYIAPDIRTAEAAKVIENTQRDLNIALVNELAIIFDRHGIDTREVLNAAATKWNFLPFEPGLVGGHCIAVDPYYLTYSAEEVKYHPSVILAGRRVNDAMGKHIAEVTVKKLIKAKKKVYSAKVLVLGITFKENLADSRNSLVVDVCQELAEYGVKVSVFDPVADKDQVKQLYGIKLLHTDEAEAPYDAIVIAVKHDLFKATVTLDRIAALSNSTPPVVIDVKGILDKKQAMSKGFVYWRL